MNSLSGLPADIQREFLSYIELNTLPRYSATSTMWQKLIKDIEVSVFNSFTAKLPEKIITALGGKEKISEFSKKVLSSPWSSVDSMTYGYYKNQSNGIYGPCISFPANKFFGNFNIPANGPIEVLTVPASVVLHLDNNLMLSIDKDCFDATQNIDWLHSFMSGAPCKTDNSSESYIQITPQSAETKKPKKYSLTHPIDKALKTAFSRFSSIMSERKKQ